MKQLFSLLLGVQALLSTSVYAEEVANKTQNTETKETFSEKEIKLLSLSYGNMIGQNLNAIGLDLDNTQILQGIQDAFNGIEPALDDTKTIEMITSLQERKFKNECETNLKAAEAFLASNKENKNIIEIEEGKLQYKQLSAGNGKICTEEDTPVIKYEGRYLDGAVFGHSEKEEPIALKETIEGFRRAIIGMKVGEKREVYIHPNLGYGSNSCLAPNALLTFEVELTGLQENTEKSEDISQMSDLPTTETFALDAEPQHETVK